MDARRVKARARTAAPHRRPVVGVLGSSDDSFAAYFDLATRLGHWLAAEGYDLLTGGGDGMMAAVSRTFYEHPARRGIVIGIVPGKVPALEALAGRHEAEPPLEYEVDPRYPNPWVEVAIYTHLPMGGQEGTAELSRNHLNVLSSDVLIALPGREGTMAELWLARQYGVPAIAYLPTDSDIALPAGVPSSSSFDEVTRFVGAHPGSGRKSTCVDRLHDI